MGFNWSSDAGSRRIAFVTFTDPKALEIALLLSVIPLFLLIYLFPLMSNLVILFVYLFIY